MNLSIGASDRQDASDSIVGGISFHDNRGVRNEVSQYGRGSEGVFESIERALTVLGECQDRFFTDLISTRGLGVRGWSSGKTEMLRSVVALPE